MKWGQYVLEKKNERLLLDTERERRAAHHKYLCRCQRCRFRSALVTVGLLVVWAGFVFGLAALIDLRFHDEQVPHEAVLP